MFFLKVNFKSTFLGDFGYISFPGVALSIVPIRLHISEDWPSCMNSVKTIFT